MSSTQIEEILIFGDLDADEVSWKTLRFDNDFYLEDDACNHCGCRALWKMSNAGMDSGRLVR